MIDWAFAGRTAVELAWAARVTLAATLAGAVLASAAGLLWAAGAGRGRHPIGLATRAIVTFLRNTPLLVQLYVLYYVMPGYGLTLTPLVTGIVGLGLHYSAYTAEIYRAGIEAVPRGQWEAARALGLGPLDTWRRVILPQAIRPVVPALGNRFIAMFKETPLLSTIAVVEMLQQAKITGAQTFRYLEPLTIVGIYFLAMSLVAARLTDRLERRIALTAAH